MSSFRPYKSRFVRAVVRQTQRWLERGQTTVRRVQVAATWSAQILLYPVYALFQSGRLLGHTIDQTVQARSPELAASPEPSEIPLEVAIAELTAETPLLNLLQEISTLVIAAEVAVLVQEPNSAIRAIACLIEPRSLVLVTHQNQILDILTPDQQHRLQQRITWEVAHNGRQRRTWNLPQQRVGRFLQGVRSRLLAPLRSSHLAGSLRSGLRSGLPSVDVPVHQVLLAVRQILASPELPMLPALTVTGSLVGQIPALAPPSYIHGVATLLSPRSLVLVTNHNDLLDILTPEQQAQIQQRIAWEIAHYYRHLRLREQPGLPPLRPPAERNLMLPPVRGFRWLMTWMQFSFVARSTNLFQESTLLACPLPAPPPSAAIGPSPKATHQRSRHQWQPLPPQANTARLPAAPPHSTLATTETIAVTTATRHPAAIATQPQPQPSGRSPSYIDTPVTLASYEQSWLERLMHWFDQRFVWLETTIVTLWQRLTGRKH